MSYIAIDKSYIEGRITELDLEIEEKRINLEKIEYSEDINDFEKIENLEKEIEELSGRIMELHLAKLESIEIPVEEHWNQLTQYDLVNAPHLLTNYPNGVIIKPK